MDKHGFYQELQDMSARFEAMEPEVCETLKDDNEGIEGYVVVWNTGISVGGPLERMGKGGTRITPQTDVDEIKMLARIMALKNAAAGLPLGGAKSGMKADSMAPEFEQDYRRFVELCRPLLFENGGVFGGFGFDIGARPEMPHWACDQLGSRKSFTGKPLDMGGTDYDKEGVAGLGVAVAAKTALEYDGKTATGASFSVQGIGAMGAAIVKYFSDYGGQLKCVSDPRIGGTWVLSNDDMTGLVHAIGKGDVEKANEILPSVGEKISDDTQEALYADVDVLFPAAVQDVIHMENVSKIKASYISEGANNLSSDAAWTWFHENGVTVIPDFIANPGGIIAAFVELTSDVEPEENVKTRANPERAKSLTIERITDNVTQVMTLVRDFDVEPAHAGRYIAFKNIFKGEA